MNNKLIKTLALSVSVILSSTMLASCNSAKTSAGDSSENAAKTIEMKLGHPAGVEHPYNTAAEMFKEKVEEASEGSIKITIFPANQLGSQEEVTEAVQLGTIDLAITSDDKLVTIVPEMGALGMPFLFNDTDEVYNALNGEVGTLLSKKLEGKNIIVASWLENGF